MPDGVGDRFQQETKYSPEGMEARSLDWAGRPDEFRSHPGAKMLVSLPAPDLLDGPTIWEALQRRRSRRAFDSDAIISLKTLSGLLWATQGITEKRAGYLFRPAPSAGALYPVETYVSVRAVDGLAPGIYHFRPERFDLEMLESGDLSRDLALAALGQGMISRAQVTFVWTAVIERSKWKYEQRAYRYIYLEAGHIAQNIYLACAALGLGVCAVGAFFDDMINQILGVDGTTETVLYMAPVGVPIRRKGGE
jgi:SagB-type dehydrogenase family enzyme